MKARLPFGTLSRRLGGAPSRWRRPAVLLASVLTVMGLLPSQHRAADGAEAQDKPAAQRAENAAAQSEKEPADPGEPKSDKPAQKKAAKKDPFAWQKLFDGKTLKGWKVPVYGGDGEVTVKDGTIVIGMGAEMTGITYTGKFPRDNFEVMLEAKRTRGYDFFATTTIPIGKGSCSFVVGGWAGTVVGLSCVDYYDAADNVTSRFMAFKDKQWYKIRIRVSEKKVECWIDEEKMVDLLREEGGKPHKFEVRAECELYCPFGISTWTTEGVVRNIKMRRLKPKEVVAIGKEK